MSVAVCRSLAPAGFESILALSSTFSASWLQQQQPPANAVAEENYDSKTIEEAEKPPEEFDMWTSIQAQKPQEKDEKKEEPYVHPLMRRSSSLLSQKSLEICTESLGSETGSDDYFSSDDEEYFFSLNKKQEIQSKHESKYEEEREEEYVSSRRNGRKELAMVNYHCCSISSRRPSPPRSFPPPLPSISRRDGPCLQMRPHRVDGRLVVEAVPVPSQNYLHAERHNGRLLLSFINTTTTAVNNDNNETENQELVEEQPEQQEEEVMTEEAEEEQEQEEEEEVEVVDRGTMVEVKISTQPPQQNNGCGTAALKVHRSSIVINKFVSCTPITTNNNHHHHHQDNHHATPAFSSHTAPISPVRRLSTTTTTAAAAAVAASSLSASSMANDNSSSAMMDNKLLLTSRRRRNRDELLHDMRRCNQLRKPLFILEPCCIATSS